MPVTIGEASNRVTVEPVELMYLTRSPVALRAFFHNFSTRVGLLASYSAAGLSRQAVAVQDSLLAIVTLRSSDAVCLFVRS